MHYHYLRYAIRRHIDLTRQFRGGDPDFFQFIYQELTWMDRFSAHGKRHVTADTALRLGRFFGTGPELWMNLQNAYDLDKAQAELGPTIQRINQWNAQVGIQ